MWERCQRWYPTTISRRIRAVGSHADRLAIIEEDGPAVMEDMIESDSETVIFADPPYASPDKRKTMRLYAYDDVCHERLFDLLADSHVGFLMTYNLAEDPIRLADERGFHAVAVPMKTAHHTLG